VLASLKRGPDLLRTLWLSSNLRPHPLTWPACEPMEPQQIHSRWASCDKIPRSTPRWGPGEGCSRRSFGEQGERCAGSGALYFKV